MRRGLFVPQLTVVYPSLQTPHMLLGEDFSPTCL
jgi:hypothetical protein